MDRFPAACAGVKLALRACHQQVQASLLDDDLGIHEADVLYQMAGVRVICGVGLYGRVPVIDGHQFHGAADLGDGLLGAGGSSAGPQNR